MDDATRQVLFLDDDRDLRDVVCELVPLFGAECIAVGSHAELLAAADRALASDLAILDINLGPGAPSGLDSCRWLRDQDFRGRIVFLTGHASSHPLVEEARKLCTAQVLAKPITPDRLQSLLEGTGA
jgi:CheY-like chemotaxis protein